MERRFCCGVGGVGEMELKNMSHGTHARTVLEGRGEEKLI
jgi:hypothetical protein